MLGVWRVVLRFSVKVERQTVLTKKELNTFSLTLWHHLHPATCHFLLNTLSSRGAHKRLTITYSVFLFPFSTREGENRGKEKQTRRHERRWIKPVLLAEEVPVPIINHPVCLSFLTLHPLQKAAVREKTKKCTRRWRRKIKTVIRFISLCSGFHWLDDVAVIGQNGFCVCSRVRLSESVCLHAFAPAEVMTKYLTLLLAFLKCSCLSKLLRLHTLGHLFPRTAWINLLFQLGEWIIARERNSSWQTVRAQKKRVCKLQCGFKRTPTVPTKSVKSVVDGLKQRRGGERRRAVEGVRMGWRGEDGSCNEVTQWGWELYEASVDV